MSENLAYIKGHLFKDVGPVVPGGPRREQCIFCDKERVFDALNDKSWAYEVPFGWSHVPPHCKDAALLAPEQRVLRLKYVTQDQAALDAVGKLFKSARTAAQLNTKSDVEIADLLMETIWADLDINSPQSVLLAAAIDRLNRAKGGPYLETDEEG